MALFIDDLAEPFIDHWQRFPHCLIHGFWRQASIPTSEYFA